MKPATSRQSWRRNLLPGAVIAAILIVGCSSAPAPAPTADEAQLPTTAPVEAPTAIASAPAADAAGPTAVAADPTAVAEPGPGGSANGDLISWSESGVVVMSADGQPLRQISSEAAIKGVLFESGHVAYQTLPSAVEILRGSEPTSINAEPERSLFLLDGGFIDGQEVLLVTSRVTQPNAPEDAEVRLFIVDVVSGEINDLGIVGGWEVSIGPALFIDDGIALVRHVNAQVSVLILNNDATIRHEIQLASEASAALVRGPGNNVLVMTPGFRLETEEPTITFKVLDTTNGSVEEQQMTLTMSGDEIAVEKRYCLTASRSLPGPIYCDQTSGPPIVIDENWHVTTVPGAVTGAVAAAIMQPSG